MGKKPDQVNRIWKAFYIDISKVSVNAATCVAINSKFSRVAVGTEK